MNDNPLPNRHRYAAEIEGYQPGIIRRVLLALHLVKRAKFPARQQKQHHGPGSSLAWCNWWQTPCQTAVIAGKFLVCSLGALPDVGVSRTNTLPVPFVSLGLGALPDVGVSRTVRKPAKTCHCVMMRYPVGAGRTIAPQGFHW